MTTTTRAASFSFRPVPAKDGDRHAKLVSSALAAGITLMEVQDLAKQKGNNGHQRPDESHDVPAYTIEDFIAVDPAFVKEVIDNLVDAAARKVFVDQFRAVDLEALTVEAVIAANRPAPRQVGVSKEALEAFVTFLTGAFAERQTAKAMANSVLDLVKGKFGTAILAKYNRQLDSIPAVLAALDEKYLPLAPEDKQAEFGKILAHFVDNFSRYLELQEAETAEIDFGAL